MKNRFKDDQFSGLNKFSGHFFVRFKKKVRFVETKRTFYALIINYFLRYITSFTNFTVRGTSGR